MFLLLTRHSAMDVVMEETFGPIVPIMKVRALGLSCYIVYLIFCSKVSSDEEAIKLMNDSPYGLTASVWTNDMKAFEGLVDEIEAGTVFQNRCDFLDPALAWTGLKKSGRGISLSKYGAIVLQSRRIHSTNESGWGF
jgi:acyl-CoA reductase-like NAD-dependent aldehyde dehydrogenase